MSHDHAIIVYFEGWINSLEPIHRLSEQLRELLDSIDGAVFDGHEIALDGSHGTLYFYCDNAKELWGLIKPTLLAADLIKCKEAMLRLGKPGTDAEEIIINLP
ncbi:hypothetical protein [Ekhidna sp.]|uniref:hypothetical protein n=1 Tax=Ekhidna sp. TaxID=2608089 RepID=UPI003CCBF523